MPLNVHAFSDGSAIGKPGPGGYGVVLTYGEARNELSEGYVRTTNNRMELLGAITALEALKRPCSVILTTDSRYVVDGINEGWAQNWKKNGWRRPKGGRALNVDLWDRLLALCKRHSVNFEWVKGHSGHPENERCDELANEAARSDPTLIDVGFDSTTP